MAHQLAYMWMEANPGRDMVSWIAGVARVTMSTGAAWPGLGQHLRHLFSPARKCKNEDLLGSFSPIFRHRLSCAMLVSTTGWVGLHWPNKKIYHSLNQGTPFSSCQTWKLPIWLILSRQKGERNSQLQQPWSGTVAIIVLPFNSIQGYVFHRTRLQP